MNRDNEEFELPPDEYTQADTNRGKELWSENYLHIAIDRRPFALVKSYRRQATLERQLRASLLRERGLQAERDEFERKGKDLCGSYGNSLLDIHKLQDRLAVMEGLLRQAKSWVPLDGAMMRDITAALTRASPLTEPEEKIN